MKKRNIKLITSMLIITIIAYMIMNLLLYKNESFATINQTQSTDINSIDSNKYPQIKEKLQELKKQHPNWNFKILYTDIEWSEAIANEYVGHGSSPRNLAPANNSKYDSTWRCAVCGDKKYDNGSWYCASEAAIEYMMDPRNSTNYYDIFQFMQLSYMDCNVQTIKKMVTNTFLNNDSYIYTLIESAKTYNVSPYYLVARIIQEQGRTGSILATGNGYNGQYVGYYNVFNIGANGSGKENIILNGLKKAQSKGWTSIESSIKGGAEIIAESYISRGQDTLYFQKFDVENSDGNLYWHQYMQNILAAQNEGSTLRKTFESVGATEAGYTFIIPLYKNMPSSAVVRPSENNTPTTTELVKVNVTNSLYLRNEPKKSATKIGSVYKDEILTRLNKATTKVDGTYWDYVMKADGTKGYAARETYESESTYKLYLVPVSQDNDNNNNNNNDKTDDNSQTIVKNDKLKFNKEINEILAVPGTTGNDFANLIGGSVSVKNSSGQIIDLNAKLATDCTINDKYTVAVLGDVNGDSNIDTADLLAIQKQLLNISVIQGNSAKKSADINGDDKIDTADLLAVQKKLLNISEIKIN